MRTRLNVFLVALATILFAPLADAASPAFATQSSSEASVTVKVTPRTLTSANWDFEVVFDTHSQALNDDLEKTAVLVADGGATQTPVKWQGDPVGRPPSRRHTAVQSGFTHACGDRIAHHAPGRSQAALVPLAVEMIH